MQNERQRILELVEKGTISAQEAITLLEALEQPGKSTQHVMNDVSKETQSFSNEKEPLFEEKSKDGDKKKDDFMKYFQDEMQDFRKDLTQIGSLFMDMMNTAVKKVKEFDVASPFGDKIEFTHTEEVAAANVDNIIVELPNGNFSLESSEGETIQVICKVKAPLMNESEEETRNHFLEQFVVKEEAQSLRILSQLKLVQVNVKVLVPKDKLEKLSVRLMNGSVSLQDTEFEELKVKTLNGAIKGTKFNFGKAEVDSSNGSIELTNVRGKDLEAETLNGRVYLDGALDEVEAKSVNGHVVVTTCSTNSSKIKAQTVAGAVELYVPRTISLSGKVVTNFGKVDVGIQDVSKMESQDQFLSKVVRFDKEVENANRLFIEGESKTGAVLVRYTTTDEQQI
ncbi:DUF4097 family beta strand repeat-containing protein [Lysinibacillus capsici]|uniref:DUF4097 family beta strand repeat-containing protein n=1 Tax=Lysinibacillus capsici TaxID=2115968 RepID=A0ABY8KDV9_9BACI|nr:MULTISPECIES: DUF4097 family beta strand repeat-containing protein [Lysinibacillus]MCR6523222.1 DUF4097 family beta strand repeat-containing protein [Lysinibacillus capsici]MDP1393402.1 DUF4097 family beta strand repeat-containing protein [Lysinibacillus capsici]MDP1413876.1 DUF4097 family beta strand repeat-containing protein [Lysinibacillus capsici]MDP1429186.1 DUF4097 family beta strand repeat-containing protein [Lysinibacillus capsici]MEC1305717.1 DUF4097 family beta strand repeat-conta